MKKIYVIGSINTDLVIHAPYIPAGGETLTGNGFFTAHGGKGANQAVAAARTGGNVIMCGCVGNDIFGESAVKALRAENIDTSNVRTEFGVSTGTAVITIVGGDNRIILDKGANAYLDNADVDKALAGASEGDILLVQLEIPVSTVAYALGAAKAKKMYRILNPAPANGEIESCLNLCDLVVPNESESEILGGKENLSARTAGDLIITLGGNGYEIRRGGKREKYSCIKVNAIDTTAAGDTFCGAMAAKLASGADIVSAAKFASVAASVACTKQGAQPSIPYGPEVEKYL